MWDAIIFAQAAVPNWDTVWNRILTEASLYSLVLLLILYYGIKLLFKYLSDQIENAKVTRERQYSLSKETIAFVSETGKSLKDLGEQVIDNKEFSKEEFRNLNDKIDKLSCTVQNLKCTKENPK